MLAERGEVAVPSSGSSIPSGVNQRFSPTLKNIYTTEGGMKGLFKGVVPRTIWISIGGAVFLGTFEFGVEVLQKRNGEEEEEEGVTRVLGETKREV
jgi:hypothetical protein